MNCSGHGKGIYAIDQNCPYNYSTELTMLASWNHHDTGYNQAHHSSENLVVNFRVFRVGCSNRGIG